MIWFRNERRLPVYWGGDVERLRQLDQQGRMVPRTSFARFLQEIRGRSVPWTVEELDSAAELGSLIEIETLRLREAFQQTVLNSSPRHIVVLNRHGAIIAVNLSWRRFAAASDAARTWAGIEAVLNGTLDHFAQDYPYESSDTRHWRCVQAYPMLAPCEGALVTHEDITARKNAEAELDRYRHHLESLVNERTLALTMANEAAELAHLASEERQRVETEAKMQSRKLEAVGTLAAGMGVKVTLPKPFSRGDLREAIKRALIC